MFRFTIAPQRIVLLFSLLCLFQVTTWFEEAVEEMIAKQNQFCVNGLQYNILPNRSFILDESLAAYAVPLDLRCLLN